jgi:death-on-curing protein
VVFLDVAEVLAIHASQIELFGGEHSVRDIALLESAVAMPQAGFGTEYLHKDIYEMAAAYLFHIVQNHPFIDGNKRTGAAAALVFLATNGVLLNSNQDEFEQMVLEVAKGHFQKPEIAAYFRECDQPHDG